MLIFVLVAVSWRFLWSRKWAKIQQNQRIMTMGESFQDYSWIQDFEAIESQPQNAKFSDYNTVNPENFARILFSRIVLKDIYVTLKFTTRAWFKYISKRHSDYGISQWFYFHETSYMRSFAKNLMKVYSSFWLWSRLYINKFQIIHYCRHSARFKSWTWVQNFRNLSFHPMWLTYTWHR